MVLMEVGEGRPRSRQRWLATGKRMEIVPFIIHPERSSSAVPARRWTQLDAEGVEEDDDDDQKAIEREREREREGRHRRH